MYDIDISVTFEICTNPCKEICVEKMYIYENMKFYTFMNKWPKTKYTTIPACRQIYYRLLIFFFAHVLVYTHVSLSMKCQVPYCDCCFNVKTIYNPLSYLHAYMKWQMNELTVRTLVSFMRLNGGNDHSPCLSY